MSTEWQRPKPHIEAEITLTPTEEGGRKGRVASGYRPHHDFGIEDMQNDAHHEYLDGELYPGQTGLAFLTFMRPDFQKGRLYEGMEFTVQEGAQIVGRGRITKILDDELRNAHN